MIRFFRSLGYAWQGLRQVVASENSFRIHLIAASVAIILMVVLRVTRTETILLILLISSILTMELVNTVVERFVGLLEPRVHSYVRMIKDIMAAAVLVNSVAAAVIGLLIFWPYFSR